MARAGKTCATPGCGKIRTHRSWCEFCAAAHEASRGSRQERGYGRDHDLIRRQLMDRLRVDLAAGRRPLCPRCGLPLLLSQDLDAGHSVDLRIDPNAKADRLEHAPCNRAWRSHHRDVE